MVHLITSANGVSAALFHVEQFRDVEWHYRWRMVGDYPTAYLRWQEGSSRESRVLIHPAQALCEIEVEWRPSPLEDWQPAVWCGVVRGTASFRVKALEDFRSASGFMAVAVVGGNLVAAWAFPPLVLHAGLETVIEGRAADMAPDNVLLDPGEFRPASAVLEIENITPSLDSLVPLVGARPRLSVFEGCHQRRFYACSGGQVAVAEMESPTPEN